MKNPYVVLGISNNATENEIKQSFRRLAKETHPDMNSGSTDSINRFHEISEAYAFLIDTDKRNSFDEELKNSNSQKSSYKYNFRSREEDYLNQELIRQYIAIVIEELAEYRKMASKATNIGLAWLFGGIIISIISYQISLNNGGGQYFIATGAILFGGIQAVKGMISSSKINRAIEDAEKELWDSVDKQFYNNSRTKSHYYKDEKEENSGYSTAENSNESNTSDFKEEQKEDQKEDHKKQNDGRANYGEKSEQERKLGVAIILMLIIVAGIVIAYSAIPVLKDDGKNAYEKENEIAEDLQKINEVIINENDRNSILGFIDISRAENFTRHTYNNEEIDNIVNAYRYLGYPVKGYNHNDLKELIISITHYQNEKSLVIDGMAGVKTMGSIAIDIVDNLVGDIVENSIKNDSQIKKIYGWVAKKVDKFTYFVAYEFDDDDNKDNGWLHNAYEVDIKKLSVLDVFYDPELELKYRNLGFTK